MISYKKNILASVFLCLFSIVSGATYYVSLSGNDAANGLTESTSWRTLSKVNSFSFQPGDKIYFKRGDTWNQTLSPSTSGTSANRITFGAYGTGNKPIISGFTTISGWTNYGNGIYSKVVSTPITPRMVTLNGVNQPMGRWPKLADNDYYIIDSHSGVNQITANELNGQNWIGGTVVVRCRMSLLNNSTITGHSGSTITFGSVESITNTNGFFITNHIGTLTKLGEWAYIGSTLYMYFGAANPDSYTVKIAAIDNLVTVSNRSYITLENLVIEGGNTGVYTSTSSYLVVQNCDIRLIGDTGLKFSGGGGSYNTINNNTITDCNNMGIECSYWREFDNYTITNNTLLNIGTIPGMGANTYQSYSGIRCWSNYSLVQYNSLTNIGYHGIAFYGFNTKIRNNFVDHALMTKSDGGGIYSVQQTEPTTTGSEITNNIVINSVGVNPIYSDYLGWGGFGIYLDDKMTNVLIDGNTVYNCSGDGIYLHGAINIVVTNNKVVGCGSKNTGNYAQFRSSRDFNAEPHSTGLVITNNQFISLNTTNPAQADLLQYAAIFQANDGASEIIASISTADNNYYAMPFFPNSGNLIRIWEGTFGVVSKWKTLAEWKAYSGKDANSNISQGSITNINQLKVIYNETQVNKIVTLDAGYIDVTGKKYSGSITLLPYTSVILMVDPNPSVAPSSPVYVSSAIENATPAILEMTYNTTLANKIPVATAFSVQVNSVARAVNAVTISGTKVLLSLASPVVNGNVVTVAYSKPATNPLQTVAGGQAANLSAQTVTNRVSSIPGVPGTPVNPVYVGSTVENETPAKIELVYNMALSNILPAISAFAVRVNSVSRSVSAIAISGNSVILTLASEVLFGDVVTVAYTKPATSALQSATGLQLATMSAQTVTNKVSSVGPIYVSSSIEKSNPNILEINYNEILDNTVPTPSAFIVMVNGINSTITSVSISGKKVLLTLANPVVYGDIITVSYIKPATNPLKKSTGEAAGSFSSPQRVTNNILKKSNMFVFPNPAREYINITIKEPSKDKQIIRIFDFSGKLCLETILDPLANTIHIPISLNSGVYIVQVILGSITSFTQKIIVTD
jgi:uncharacterized repeat protein (TIGR02059 family)